MSDSRIDFLRSLEEIILQRLADRPDDSYTAQLVATGKNRVAQKVGEEAIELILATTTGDRREQIDEAADLVFHLLVLLASNGIGLVDVVERLKQRHEQRPDPDR